MRGRTVALGLLIVTILIALALYARHPAGDPEDARLTQDRSASRPLLRAPEGDHPLTLAVLGTSLTAGSGWPDAVALALEQCIKRPVRLVRHAAGGWTSVQGMSRIDAVIADAPDVVTIEFTINDADLRRGVGVRESLRLHRAMLERLKNDLPQTGVMLLRLNRAHGMRALLRPRLSHYEAALPRLAAEFGAAFVDLRPDWTAALERAPDQAVLLPDGLHPTDAAARQIVVRPVVAAIAGGEEKNCDAP